ncbi:hypothetical protein ACLOJK_013411 [Asimina triloba]
MTSPGVGFSNFLCNLSTLAIFVLFMLFLELAHMIKAAVGVICSDDGNSYSRPHSGSRYLSLLDKRHPVVLFERRMSRLESVDCCAVCICEFEQGEEIRELRCKHAFHKDCLDRWLDRSCAAYPTCPLCRSLVLPEDTMMDDCRSLQEYFYGEDDFGFMFLSSYGGNLHRLWATYT